MCVGEDSPELTDSSSSVISVYLLLFAASVQRWREGNDLCVQWQQQVFGLQWRQCTSLSHRIGWSPKAALFICGNLCEMQNYNWVRAKSAGTFLQTCCNSKQVLFFRQLLFFCLFSHLKIFDRRNFLMKASHPLAASFASFHPPPVPFPMLHQIFLMLFFIFLPEKWMVALSHQGV